MARSFPPRWPSLSALALGALLLAPGAAAAQSGPTATPPPAQTATPSPPAAKDVPRKINPADISLPAGYKIEPVVTNLSVLTTLAFDRRDLLVAESGWQDTAKPRILRLSLDKPDGAVQPLAADGLEWPVTGLLVDGSTLYVSHKGTVSIVGPGGALKDIVADLPSKGDHQNNTLALGPDGKLYMGQGTLTNSAVVGIDNYVFGWLAERPELHEIPCQDITLVGDNFESDDPLHRGGPKVRTGAYKPFGQTSTPGEVIKGNVKCGGSIVRFNRDGSGFELVAWGLRNPYGVRFDKSGQLWATYHGADVRGSRNIYTDPDYMVRVEPGAWYGWPEYFDAKPVTDGAFDAPGHPNPTFLWKDHPPVAKPFTTFGTHEGVNGFDFSPGGPFGFPGDAFVAMFGTFAPVTTGVNIAPVGFRLVRVDMRTGKVNDFAQNKLPGPNYLNQQGGLSRPSDVVFGPDGALYVADWGHSTLTEKGLQLTPQTGVVWRIYPDALPALRPNGPVVVSAAPVPETKRGAEVRNVPEGYKMIAPELMIILGLIAVVVLVLWGAVFLARRRHPAH